MQIIPLGGAGEVGASSAILDVDGARLLIDAGIRTSSAGRKNPLPAFAQIGERRPDAVLVTHAHTDHTGALPMILGIIGDAPIHMTVGTLHVVEVLQLDAVRHIEEGDVEGAVRYTTEDVENMIARVVPHTFMKPFCPIPGRDDIQVTCIPCGHVLGAAMLAIETPNWHILWTGDYSVSPQPTIGGVDLALIEQIAARRPFDLMVTEGTYGAEVHPAREHEESRLVEMLERATRKGGRVLIPAFAVGRSQDVGMIIRRAKLEGRLQDVGVYLDGMVRGVTSIYQNIAHEIYPGISEPLQILDPELGIHRANAQSRAKLCVGDVDGPAIVIASSGMLMGGQSVEYAAAFAPGRANSILVVGYQDEESPGRALLKLKRGGLLNLGDRGKVRARCFVGRYGLSAHADFAQVSAVVRAANPRRIAVVHGDPGALKAFAKAMKDVKPRSRTKVFRNGEAFEMKRGRKVWQLPAIEAPPEEEIVARAASLRQHNAGGATMPDATAVRHLWSILAESGDRAFAEHEICRMFLGNAYSTEERKALSRVLSDHRLYFLTGSATGQRSYRPRPREELVEMMVERASAFQVPIPHGAVVVFCDGSTDLFVAAADRPGKDEEVACVVAQASRRTFRKEWLRAVTPVSADKMLTGHRGVCARWLEELVREARGIPVNALDLYQLAAEAGDRSIDVGEAFALLFPLGHDHPDAAHLSVGMALASANDLFVLRSDGRHVARSVEEASVRRPGVVGHALIRALPPGAEVRLTSGETVRITGQLGPQSFEASLPNGRTIRCNYRRVDAPV
jgi:predicted metal-dependent RNase